jgi:hypothetical protein
MESKYDCCRWGEKYYWDEDTPDLLGCCAKCVIP